MGKLIAGLASSHAFTFRDPSEWDGFRQRIDAGYKRRYGREPEPHPGVAAETPEDNRRRYRNIRDGIETLHRELAEARPDALILIGDDQNENFHPDHLLPQLAIHTGEDFRFRGRGAAGDRPCRSHPELARTLLATAVEAEFDLATCAGFAGGALTSHAHYEILENVVRDLDIPVVVIFVNALHIPAISPGRCHAFGRTIRDAVAARPDGERIAIYASGGLSHFTGGFPWPHYDGPFAYGGISEAFDRQCLEDMRAGDGARLAALSSADLLRHGDIEMRSWIVLLGALGDAPARMAVYEPFYRGMMGMAVASWRPD